MTAVVSGQRVARVPGTVLGSGHSIAEGPAGGAADCEAAAPPAQLRALGLWGLCGWPRFTLARPA